MIVGVTGSVGTGKSTVSRMFAENGAVRIDTDRLAHEALEKRNAPHRKVVLTFGRGILQKGGKISRPKLARVVFQDAKALKCLNRLIHPYVIRRIKEEIRRRTRKTRKRCIVIEVPLLFEARLRGMFDKIITVSCQKSIQESRWVKAGRSLRALKERCASQLPLSYKKKHSDFIIDNSGERRKTHAQVNRIWRMIVQ